MLHCALSSFLLASALINAPAALAKQGSKRPNVVFFLTDDQDAKMNSLDYMPAVQKHLVQKGTHYQKHYCTVAWCCPSRVSLWTGKTAHNTNVTNVEPPYGGYPKFIEEGHNNNWVPVWLQGAGYQTYYVGKLMNYQHILNYNKPFAKGFNGSDFLLDPNTYAYNNPIFQRNHELPVLHKNEYSTDLVAKKALGFLDDAAKHPDSPFFLAITPIAPHANFEIQVTTSLSDIAASGNLSSSDPPIGIITSPPVSAPRHENLFPDAIVPRTPNFNPVIPSGVDWIADTERLSAENITYNDLWYRKRLQSLQAVDEMVDQVIAKLEAEGLLDNTYIFYSADNGYHISQHRLQPGKGCGIEEDINVPLVVRGPNVPQGEVVNLATSHTDLAPTFFEIMGIPLRRDFDGVPIPTTKKSISELQGSGKAKEHVQIEFWSTGNPGEYNDNEPSVVNNTYKGLRIVGEEYGFYYSVWCSGSHELYDMKTDPYQLHNLYTNPSNTTSSTPYPNATTINIALGSHTYPLTLIETRLDSLLFVLKTCKATSCSNPWDTLLPKSGVFTLTEAMNPKYDEYFAALPRVHYERCEGGYIEDAEGPVWTHEMANEETRGLEGMHGYGRMGRGRGMLNRA